MDDLGVPLFFGNINTFSFKRRKSMIFSAFASDQAESFVAPLPAGYHGRVGAPNPRSGKHVGFAMKKNTAKMVV